MIEKFTHIAVIISPERAPTDAAIVFAMFVTASCFTVFGFILGVAWTFVRANALWRIK